MDIDKHNSNDPRSIFEGDKQLLVKSQETSIEMDVDADHKLKDQDNSKKDQVSKQSSEKKNNTKAVNGKEVKSSRRYRIMRRPTAFKSIALLPGVRDFSEMNSSDSSSSNCDASSDSEIEARGLDLIGRRIKPICKD